MGGNPRELMKEMEKQQRNHPNSKEAPTEYWIILDKEQSNVNRSLEPLYAWVRKSEANNLGITNTQFENWLLLHFQQKWRVRIPFMIYQNISKAIHAGIKV